ncbi:MAG TPA: copper chaperone PCu(A)C [Telluria sp.]|nr:copper chaperone PCu(A)C [Telluria sp.]
MNKTRKILAVAAVALLSSCALAQVKVSDQWIRATVPQQGTGGAYLSVRSATAARLVEVRTPVAERAELHAMKMEGQTMRMEKVDSIALPANKAVDLGPGGYHVMLFGLKRQLKDGETVPLTLVLEGAGGKRTETVVNMPVKPLAYQAPKR